MAPNSNISRVAIATMLFLLAFGFVQPMAWAQPQDEGALDPVEIALVKAGANRVEFERALASTAKEQQKGLRFLISHMPERDLKSLTSEFLVENVLFAYRAWKQSPWHKLVPEEVFLNEILPYANINERRDRWRKDFYERFAKIVKNADSPGKAASLLNHHIFKTLNVRYSTKRPKPDQSPFESMKAGTASCTGLSILLIDACRAVGVPARFVGTPLWSDGSGNHSWVEIWDQGWHFTGAAEPTGEELNKGWFEARASKALRDDAKRAIYAVSFRKTPQHFPLLWAEQARYVSAVNVSDRYTSRGLVIPKGKGRVRFRMRQANGVRRSQAIHVVDSKGTSVFRGTTNDERFDANDHLTAHLAVGGSYVLTWTDTNGVDRKLAFVASKDEQLVDVQEEGAVDDPIEALRSHLKRSPSTRGAISEQDFAKVALTKEQSNIAKKVLWDDHVATIRRTRAAEMEAKVIQYNDKKMKFYYKVFGEQPKTGRSLYISMHGGGGAPSRVNDQQWENQKRLYQPKEGVYVAPRAPTDTWNLWHQGHIDPMFDRLIENMIVFENVDPNRVYIMGYSAGGDGTYQLAPRMADRWAAAAMMAGHPNETKPLGLRNVGFILQMGGKDSAYKRNKIAADWSKKLARLKKNDPNGYHHLVKIYPDKGHWMDREDAMALPWMAKFRRDLRAHRIVWLQDDVCHSRFYWLAVSGENKKQRSRIDARRRGQKIELKSSDVSLVTVRLDDEMIDLDKTVQFSVKGKIVQQGIMRRTIAVIAKTLAERGDPYGMFSSEVVVDLKLQ